MNRTAPPIAQRGEQLLPWLLAMACLSLFLGLGQTPLIDLDEGAFTAATQEMVLRGNYLHTYLNGEPRYDKPILVYWLQAGSALVWGFHEWALRLPSALMGLAWTLLVFHLVQRLSTRPQAYMAAIVTATAVGTVFIFRLAIADALLNFFIAAAVLLQWAWVRQGRAADLRLAWLAMGLGVLTKGPVAVVFPMATLFLYALSSKQWSLLWRYVADAWAWALLLCAALPWYIVVTVVVGPDFLVNFLLKHNLGRFTGSMGQYHQRGAWFYLPVVAVIMLPYTGVLLSVLLRIRQQWQTDFARYALILFLLVLLFFSLSSNKLPHYVIYGFSGVLVLIGLQAAQGGPRWWLVPGVLLFLGGVALPFLLDAVKGSANPYYQTVLVDLDSHFNLRYHLLLGAGSLVCLWMLWDRYWSVAAKLATQGVMASLAIGNLFLPALGGVIQGPIQRAGQLAATLEAPLRMHGINTPSFGVYAGRLVGRDAPQPGDVVLTTTSAQSSLAQHQVLLHDKNILLVRMLPAQN